ncbi:MAG: hypothetical protein AB1815_10325 [Bacillota bacterium]
MSCQLDEVIQVFNVAKGVRNALLKHYPDRPEMADLGRRATSVACGLLLLEGFDVFIKDGMVRLEGRDIQHCWLEIFLNGEEFIWDITLIQFSRQVGQELPNTVFMLKEEAEELYGYGQSTDYDWQADDCPLQVWQDALDYLKLDRMAAEVISEVAELA